MADMLPVTRGAIAAKASVTAAAEAAEAAVVAEVEAGSFSDDICANVLMVYLYN